MKKNIMEFLDTMDKDATISVGSQNGSSYFFIGSVEEFREKLEDLSAKIDLEMAERFQRSFLQLEHFISEEFSNDSVAQAVMSGERVFDEETTMRMKAMYQYAASFDRARKKFLTFVPLKERNVVEAYPSITEENNTRVIIEGKEAGEFWFASEAKKGA